MKIKVLKEKLLICWKLLKADQYFFCSYRGDMSVAVQNLGRKNLSCYSSDNLYPIFIKTAKGMCEMLFDKSDKTWEAVGIKIWTFDDFFWLLNHGTYIYLSKPDEYMIKEKRRVIKGNPKTKHIEMYEAGKDGKLLADYPCGDECREKLYEPMVEAGEMFFYLHYEKREDAPEVETETVSEE